MTMLEAVFKDGIFIDFGADILYGSDQMYISCPVRFATAGFQLISTSFLSGIADRIRKDLGFAPMGPMDEYTDDTCDNDGWYDFYYGIDDLDGGRGDGCIEFAVCNSDSPDNEERYTIELTPEEQEEMYCRMNEQCLQYLGKGCRELLNEADERMREELEEENGK